MSSIDRRHMLCLSAAAVGGMALRPLSVVADDKVCRTSSHAASSSAALCAEHFENGVATVETAHVTALAEMLLDLHRRREYDRSCHAGGAGPHESYLTSWIDFVTAELHSRREDAAA